MATLKPPPLSVLDHSLVSTDRPMPLHHQVRRVLRRAIDDHFEHEQTFWTEAMLIERLGVSRITVRQALAELSREGLLVRQAARGSFVRKETATPVLGVFVPRYDSDFYTGILEQIAQIARERKQRLDIYHTQDGEGINQTLKQLVRKPQEEQLLLLCGKNPELFEVIKEREYPYVLIDALFPGYNGPFVGTDNDLGIRLGMEHLIEQGHRKILMLVNEPEEALSVQQRIASFEKVLRDYGLEKEGRIFSCNTRFGEDSFTKALEAIPRLWDSGPVPTAIFATSDPGAWAALKWLSNQQIRVPESVSVLGFEDVRPSRFTNPALSTVAHPMAEIARKAVDMVTRKKNVFDNSEGKEEQLYLVPKLVVRESTGPATHKNYIVPSSHCGLDLCTEER